MAVCEYEKADCKIESPEVNMLIEKLRYQVDKDNTVYENKIISFG